MVRTHAIEFGTSWTDQGTSIRLDVVSLAVALALHAPLYFMKLDAHKKATDRPTSRLVAVDLIDPEAPKPVEAPPVEKKESSLMMKLKALVKKDPPPPAPDKKVPDKLLDA